jgi:hypothetical protein
MFSRLKKVARYPHIWLPGYLESRISRPAAPPKRAWLAIADHYEPGWNNVDLQTQLDRVKVWTDAWPEIASRHCDSMGRSPRYTFFYPEDQYLPELVDPLRRMTDQGIADVEVHIHHDREGEQIFVERMSRFLESLERRHGLLRRRNGKPAFGFIHGDWVLDNSDPTGFQCGLNNEITILRDLGCYADFTLPCPHTEAQVRMVNTIYWATDDPLGPKSHDLGIPVRPGDGVRGDLMIIPGPLAINWKERMRAIAPRLETGELAGYSRPSQHRARLWLKCGPRVGDDVFIKLYAHGAPERNAGPMLGGDLDRVFEFMAQACAETGTNLHFVTTWEMFNAVEALRQKRDPVESVQNLGLHLASANGESQ